jgi:LemA protein
VTAWFIVVLIAVAAGVAWMFNRVISLRQRARAAWSDIDVQLKRRWDLVPALVSTVKGYTTHESETLQNVVRARRQAMVTADTGSVAERGKHELSLAAAARSLVAVVEDYPDLEANEHFLELQNSLVQVEDTLQYARRYYNAVVRDYNVMIASFPTLLIAGVFGFTPIEFFQIDGDERTAPSVDL